MSENLVKQLGKLLTYFVPQLVRDLGAAEWQPRILVSNRNGKSRSK